MDTAPSSSQQTGIDGLANGHEPNSSSVAEAQHVLVPSRSYSPSHPPTSAEIDAVIAAAMANAPPPPPPNPPSHSDFGEAGMYRSVTPLMTNLLPAAVGADGRVNLFVGNLPYRVRWQDLKDLFRKAGTVLRADVSLGPDNRSRGYGTVLMGSREDAARAIDRFNGYNWQTRTLEVRPDRLPPEYEAQPHVHVHPMGQGRPPPFGYGHAPFPGGIPPGAMAWLQQQNGGQRPPMPPPGNSNHGYAGSGPAGGPGGMMGMMNPLSHAQHFSPHASPPPPHQPGSGASPPQGMHPPGGLHPLYGSSGGLSGGAPGLAAQHSGTTQHHINAGASPLAGALTGLGPVASLAGRRDSASPFAQAAGSPPGAQAEPSSTSSPALPISRPASTSIPPPSHPASSAAQSLAGSEASSARPGLPGSLGSLPPSLLAAAAAGNASRSSISLADPLRRSSAVMTGSDGVLAGTGVAPMALEGLASQGMGLGPPENLHDRVVFVSNLPLTMQWQDLKDLLRPAGLIIRADIAQDDHRKPRGYGTALFATIADAARAVDMFNEMDVGGRSIRVYLERNAHLHPHRSDTPSAPNSNATTSEAGADDAAGETRSTTIESQAEQAPAATSKLPWVLNTANVGQTVTPNRGMQAQGSRAGGPHAHTPAFRHFAHPGPISMPSFSPMDPTSMIPSPLQTGRLPPMTPSMPGFVFNAYPETPPVAHHHAMLSPGIAGPFSPGIPVTSPTQFSFSNPFLNAAPGAPVYPQHRGSAALGTPTTQSFPSFGQVQANAQQQQQQQQQRGGGGGGGGPVGYFPPVPLDEDTSSQAVGSTLTSNSRSDSATAPSKPLNAQDRLASTTDDEIIDLKKLSIGHDGDSSHGKLSNGGGRRHTPPSPIGGAARRLSAVDRHHIGSDTHPHHPATTNRIAAQVNPALARLRELGGGRAAGAADGGGEDRSAGRQSLDEHRPSLGLLALEGERRASFGAFTK